MLIKLGAHSDVYVTPRTDHHQSDDRTEHAALAMGGGYQHELRICFGSSMSSADRASRISSRS